jgi:hypothetical protein
MRRSLTDLIANADRLADAFENHDPTPGDFDTPLPPLMAVKLAAFRRSQAEKDLAEAIATPAWRTCPGVNSARRSGPAAKPPANATPHPDPPVLLPSRLKLPTPCARPPRRHPDPGTGALLPDLPYTSCRSRTPLLRR